MDQILIEAPIRRHDGKRLVLNGDGRLADTALVPIPLEECPTSTMITCCTPTESTTATAGSAFPPRTLCGRV
jgi:hypothetical protein